MTEKMNNIQIPEVSNDQISAVLAKMKPVRSNKNGSLNYLSYLDVDYRTESYHFAHKVLEKAEGLNAIDIDVTSYHSWSYYGFFKPTMAEVVAYIPQEILENEDVVAFEVIGPKDSNDLSSQKDIVNQGFHKAKLRFYKKL